jgi:hypothetical protein
MRGPAKFRRLLAAATLWVAAAGLPLGAQVSEYQVKAAYLYQFLNFVEWPPRSAGAADASYEICILGIDPFGSDLDAAVQGKHVRGRAVHVQRIAAVDGATRCHVLFVAASERPRLSWILDSVSGQPLLTVGEVREFEEQGGMVRFVVQHDNVRLHINPDAAGAAGLQISSKLLAVATVVKKGSGL